MKASEIRSGSFMVDNPQQERTVPDSMNSPEKADNERGATLGARATATAYARGAVGGLIVAMPLLMTMEMWWGGFQIPAHRLIALILVNFGVLFILQHYSGLHHRKSTAGELRAAAAAYGIGLLVSLLTLFALNIVQVGSDARDVIGKLLLESVPVSIGASVSISQFGASNKVAARRKDQEGFGGAMAMALAGAMFFGFSVAPTEEAIILGLRTTPVHVIVLLLASIVLVHLVVYAVEFRSERVSDRRGRWRLLLEEGVSTYAVAIAVSAFLLWTFGRVGSDVGWIATRDMIVSLGLVTSLGAAAGELLI